MRAFELLLEANIVNVSEIDPFVAEVAGRAQTPAVAQYVRSKLPAWLRKSYKRTEKVTHRDLPNYFNEVPDWASQGVDNGTLERAVLDHQLANEIGELIDYLESEAGHGFNLSRLPFDQAIAKARAWHAELARAKPVAGDVDDGASKVIRSYSNGYRWLQLLTPQCLDVEGSKMGHCVGGGSYDSGLSSGNIQIYSLRDAKDEPHVTVEVRSKQLAQVKGKQNKAPVAKYRRAVLDFLNLPIMSGVDGSSCDDLTVLGIFAGSGKYGTIEEVADDRHDLQSGHRFLQLTRSNRNLGFIVDDSGNILGRTQSRDADLLGASVSDGVPRKSLRQDYIEIMGMFEKVSLNAQNNLRNYFGVVKTDKVEHVHEHGKLLGKEGEFTAYLVSEDSLYVLDRDNHPLIVVGVSMGRHGYTTVETDAGWEEAIPLMLRTLQELNAVPAPELISKLKQAGYVQTDSTWVPIDEAISGSQPVFPATRGHWYMIGRNLLLVHNQQVTASLLVSKRDDGFIVKGCDRAYSKLVEPYIYDITDLLERDEIEMDSYAEEEGFLLEYDIYYDGAEFFKIDWDEDVTVTVEYANTVGDIVKTSSNEQPLRSALDLVGFLGESSALQMSFFPAFFSGRAYEDIQHDVYDETQGIESYYDDPEGYREDNDIPENEDLPEIDTMTTIIER